LNLYVSSDTARDYFLEMHRIQKANGNRGDEIKRYAATGIRPERVIKLQHDLGAELVERLASLVGFDEFSVLNGASAFLSGELGIDVRVFKAGEKATPDPAKRSSGALPFKPSFYLE